jgi:RNA polymerase sigma-70 factor (ECF subfamily)
MTVSKIHEKLLLARLRKKDPDAFGEMYDLYVTPIYRFIYLKVSSRPDAEDLTSDVFLRTWQYVTTTDKSIGNFRALVYRIARIAVIDFYRRRAKQELASDDEMLSQVVDERQQSLLQEIDISIDVDKVHLVLQQMKDDYREVIILRYIEQLSVRDIAIILGKSSGAVRVLLSRSLKVARGLLDQGNNKTDAR